MWRVNPARPHVDARVKIAVLLVATLGVFTAADAWEWCFWFAALAVTVSSARMGACGCFARHAARRHHLDVYACGRFSSPATDMERCRLRVPSGSTPSAG
ncbi:MAG: hypothetical protein ACLTSX_03145 [Collinsella sp.]